MPSLWRNLAEAVAHAREHAVAAAGEAHMLHLLVIILIIVLILGAFGGGYGVVNRPLGAYPAPYWYGGGLVWLVLFILLLLLLTGQLG